MDCSAHYYFTTVSHFCLFFFKIISFSELIITRCLMPIIYFSTCEQLAADTFLVHILIPRNLYDKKMITEYYTSKKKEKY